MTVLRILFFFIVLVASQEHSIKLIGYGVDSQLVVVNHSQVTLQYTSTQPIHHFIFSLQCAENTTYVIQLGYMTLGEMTIDGIEGVKLENIIEDDSLIFFQSPLNDHEIYIISNKLSSRVVLTDWMNTLGSLSNTPGALGSLPLVSVALPGTHDSGTFNLTLVPIEPPDAFTLIIQDVCIVLNKFGIEINCTVPEIVADALSYPWAVTQNYDWKLQLEQGARSIDYRGYYLEDTNEWVIQHSLAGTNRTSPEALGHTVVEFLNAHPGELVVIEYTNYNGNVTDLVNRFTRVLGDLCYHWTDGVTIPGNPTISQMIANNQRAILVAANYNSGGPVNQGISNDYPDSCNLNYILNYDTNAMKNFANETDDAMRKIGYQVTADADCVVLGILGTVLLQSNLLCKPTTGFLCSDTLVGYIKQLNSRFTLHYVVSAFSQVSPILETTYFGNIWNFDLVEPELTGIVISLNLITMANSLIQ